MRCQREGTSLKCNLLGLGNDLIEIGRLREGYEAHGKAFLQRLFTPKEQEYCERQRDPFPRYAGRFAAKEAIVKALGSGFGSEISWQDIEILPDAHGKPEVQFSGKLKATFHNPHVLLTITHCKEYASAVAIWVSQDNS